jgi:hypothetical protein
MVAEKEFETIVRKAIVDDQILSELLHGILSKNDDIRSKNYRILLQISKTHQNILYSKWNFFADLLESKNHFHRYMAINLLANLASVDTYQKFQEIFDIYFNNISSEKTMVAGQTVLNSGKIAKEIPMLRSKITSILLNVDMIHQGKQTELMKGYAIQAFDDFFEEIENKNEIINFVKLQLKSNSPKSKKAAKEFLEKWNC